MKCPQCGTDNPVGARFCMNCGSGLDTGSVSPCPACGDEIPVAARLCPGCGTPRGGGTRNGLAQSTAAAHNDMLSRLAPRKYVEQLIASSGRITGERRVVTILFCDIKGSTAMAENLDPEDVMEIMNDAFEILIGPIYRYEGTVARIMGDAVLAFFGAPISHEDDPARACRAALDIIEQSREYAARLDRDRGIPDFDVRVGINTGLVVVGEVGSDLRVEYTAMGDAVNLAKRMESAAEPGTVLLSQSTHKLISSLFNTDNLGSISVKGRSQQVPVFRLLRPKSGNGSAQSDTAGEARIIGRAAELARLRSGLARLREGSGGTFAVVGEAGLGKSRLIREARRLEGDAVSWAEGRCISYAKDVGYWIVRDLLEQLLEGEESGDREELDHDLGRLLDIRPADMRNAQQGTETRPGTIAAFRDYIRKRSRAHPLVLVWQDLHWIDPSSLELLETLVPLTDEVPLLLVLLFRPDEGGMRGLNERLVKSRGERYNVIEMGPLGRGDSARLLEQLLDGTEIPRETFDLILDHSEGNAFFMEEVVCSLKDAGLLNPKRDSALTAAEIKKLGIPTTLHGAIMSHVDRLPQQDKRILQTASVLGRVFERDVLAKTLDPPLEDIRLDLFLLNLCSRGFLELRSGDGESEHESMLPKNIALWRTLPLDGAARVQPAFGPSGAKYYFKNPATAEVTYNSLLKSQRVDMHRRAGEAIDTVHPDRAEEFAPLLAYHFEKGKVFAKAFLSLISVARRAAAIDAVPAALAGYRKAVSVEREDPERVAAEALKAGIDMPSVHEELGDVLYTAGEYGEALEQYERALELTDDRERRGRLRRKKGQACEGRGEYGEAKRHFEAALSELRDGRNGLETARIHAGIGIACYLLGDPAGADESIRRALSMMEQHGNDRDIALARSYLGIVCCKNEDWAPAADHHRRCIEIYEGAGHTYGLAASRNNLGVALMGMGDPDGAADDFARSLGLFEQLDDRRGIACARDNLERARRERGQGEKPAENARKALGCLTEIGREESGIFLELWRSGD